MLLIFDIIYMGHKSTRTYRAVIKFQNGIVRFTSVQSIKPIVLMACHIGSQNTSWLSVSVQEYSCYGTEPCAMMLMIMFFIFIFICNRLGMN